jgi:hypothetical protein
MTRELCCSVHYNFFSRGESVPGQDDGEAEVVQPLASPLVNEICELDAAFGRLFYSLSSKREDKVRLVSYRFVDSPL